MQLYFLGIQPLDLWNLRISTVQPVDHKVEKLKKTATPPKFNIVPEK